MKQFVFCVLICVLVACLPVFGLSPRKGVGNPDLTELRVFVADLLRQRTPVDVLRLYPEHGALHTWGLVPSPWAREDDPSELLDQVEQALEARDTQGARDLVGLILSMTTGEEARNLMLDLGRMCIAYNDPDLALSWLGDLNSGLIQSRREESLLVQAYLNLALGRYAAASAVCRSGYDDSVTPDVVQTLLIIDSLACAGMGDTRKAVFIMNQVGRYGQGTPAELAKHFSDNAFTRATLP